MKNKEMLFLWKQLIFLFFPLSTVCGQTLLMPAFKPQIEDTFKKNTRKTLDTFISNGTIVTESLVRGCETQYGEFKFKINLKGEVDSLIYNGNLNKKTSDRIKENILLTKSHWKMPSNEENISYWFTFPFFSFISQEPNKCKPSDIESQKNFNLTYKLLTSLPYDNNGVTKTMSGYLIKPGCSNPMSVK